MNRWVGLSVIMLGCLAAAWSWHTTQEREQLTMQLSTTRAAAMRMRADTAKLSAELAQAKQAMEQARVAHMQFEGTIEVLTNQLATAETAREELDAQLMAIRAREVGWHAEKTRLQQRVGQLQSSLGRMNHAPMPPEDQSDVRAQAGSVVPPTGSQDAGVRGTVVHQGTLKPVGAKIQVDVRSDEPATSSWKRRQFPWH